MKNLILQIKRKRFQLDKLFWFLLAKTTPPPGSEYDLAIAFTEGAANYYVADSVKAVKKISFIHVNYEKAGYMKELDRLYYKKADYICCVSEQLRAALNADVFPEFAYKTRVFQNIVNPGDIVRASLEDGGFDDDFEGIRIVTVARLHPQKGLDAAIEAMSKFNRRENIRWYVLGDGSEKIKLTRLIKKYELESNFFLLGAKDNPFPFIRQSDIYVQPSKFEGFGLSLMEALILQKPCITTDFDGVPNFLTDGKDAVIIQFSVENIYGAVKKLVNDPDLRNQITTQAADIPLAYPNKTHILYDIMNGKPWEDAPV